MPHAMVCMVDVGGYLELAEDVEMGIWTLNGRRL